MEPITIASAAEHYDFSKLEVLEEARAQLAVANKEFMRTACELMTARRLGEPLEALFAELQAMHRVKARAEEAFRAAHG